MINEMGNSKDANDYLKKMADDLATNPPVDTNGGHNALMQDLSEILYEAFHYEFNDFKNEKYAAPKMTLVSKLQEVIDHAKNGKYDN